MRARQKVLVPQVYLSQLHADSLQPDGALIAANDIALTAGTVNNSGRLTGNPPEIRGVQK